MPTGSTAVSAVVAATSVKAILANLGLLVLNGCWWVTGLSGGRASVWRGWLLR